MPVPEPPRPRRRRARRRGGPAASRWRREPALAVAWRYLRSARRDAFVSFLSATAAGGLALGTAALLLALGALAGFQEALRDEVLARTPEIEVELPSGAEPREALARVRALPEVRQARLLAGGHGWLIHAGRVRPAELIGYEGSLPASFAGAGSAEGEGLWVGDRLAELWGLETGDVVEVASGRPTLTPAGPRPRTRRLPLAGTFDTGRTELEERAALPLASARALFGGDAYRLEISTGSLDGALAAAAPVAEVLPPGSAVRTWREINRGLFFALRLEKTLMFAAVFLIVVVAALALVSDVTLVIASKRSEIGILGALGAPPAMVHRIFLWLGAMLAAGGVLAGGALGATGAGLLDHYRVLSIPGGVYFLDYVPFRVGLGEAGLILASTLGLTLISAWWAARKAAALEPVEALRR